MSVRLNTSYLGGFVNENELAYAAPAVKAAHELLVSGKGPGSDFLGWVDLPETYDREELARIKVAAEKIRKTSKVLVVIGIGGSYLGARAVIEMVGGSLGGHRDPDAPRILFAGNTISPSYTAEVLEICKNCDFSVNVISKSGTTTEPALAFRAFRKLLTEKYGAEGAKERIFVTTDKAKGTLKKMSDEEGYETFVVPDDVGGRFSVLTAVGLLPIAAAGLDVDALLAGAAAARNAFADPDIEKNDCYRYAALRNIFYHKGKVNELLVSYEPSFTMMGEWFKQLFGESEGKDGKGIFPCSATFSTDLHSLGQYIQQGRRLMFETVVDIKAPVSELTVEDDPADPDGLGFLSGEKVSGINRTAMEATILAHTDGGVPNVVIEIDGMTEFDAGELIYFFEKACAISGYMLGVNPFDQPGVESYKRNMFALLGKPGYEAEKAEIEKRLRGQKA